MRIARFAKGDGVAYGVVEGSGPGVSIAELYGHPFGVDPGGVRLTGNRYPLAEVDAIVAEGARLLDFTGPAAPGEPPASPVAHDIRVVSPVS